MKPIKTFSLLIYVASTIVFAGLVWANKAILFNESFLNTASMQSQGKAVDNRCWFRSREGIDSASQKMIKQRREREEILVFGYSTDIPLSEAVKIFNEEMQCVSTYQSYPPLTEDEVVAAIAAGVNGNERGTKFLAERDALWKIATKRTMPKGSILNFWSGGNIQGSPLSPYKTIQAKGIEIFLMLGLDKNGRSDFPSVPKLEETLTIRKTFYGVETVK